MKIVITGNMGYVGPCVVRQLRKSYLGAEIIGVDYGFFAHCLTGSPVLPEVLLDRQYFCDIRYLPEEILRNTDVVVNLAAISNDPMGNIFENVTMDINYRAAVNLAAMAKKAGAGVYIFASSCSVYGCADDGIARN